MVYLPGELGALVTLVGWHDYRNLGDDAMLEVIGSAYEKSRIGFPVQIFAKRSSGRLNSQPLNVINSASFQGRLVSRAKLSYIASLSQESRVWRLPHEQSILLFGGGNIFHSESSIHWKYNLLKAHRTRVRGFFSAAVGVGFGPFPDVASEALALEMVKQLDAVIVRDQYSFDFVCAARGSDKFVSLAPDLAICLGRDFERTRDDSQSLEGTEVGKVHKLLLAPNGPLVRGLPRADRSKFRQIVVDVATRLSSDITLMATCAHSRAGDDRECRVMADLFGKRGLTPKVVNYSSDPTKTAEKLESFDLVVSQRLHPLILSNANRSELYFYGQTGSKISQVMRQVGFEEAELNPQGIGLARLRPTASANPNELAKIAEGALRDVFAQAKLKLSL